MQSINLRTDVRKCLVPLCDSRFEHLMMHGQKHATKDTIKYAGFVSEFQVNIINMSAHYMCGATHVLKYDKTMC